MISNRLPAHALAGVYAVIAAAAMAGACRNSDASGPSVPPPPLIPAIELIFPPQTVGVGEAVQLHVSTTAGVPVSSSSLGWTSSNPSVATVSPTGGVQGVARGLATITASVTDEDGVAVRLSLSIGEPAASITITPGPDTLDTSQCQTVVITAALRDAAGQVLSGRAVSWTSNSDSVAVVDDNMLGQGIVLGMATGTTMIVGRTGAASGAVSVVVTGGQLPYYCT